jgi:hypothetical protein
MRVPCRVTTHLHMRPQAPVGAPLVGALFLHHERVREANRAPTGGVSTIFHAVLSGPLSARSC